MLFLAASDGGEGHINQNEMDASDFQGHIRGASGNCLEITYLLYDFQWMEFQQLPIANHRSQHSIGGQIAQITPGEHMFKSPRINMFRNPGIHVFKNPVIRMLENPGKHMFKSPVINTLGK